MSTVCDEEEGVRLLTAPDEHDKHEGEYGSLPDSDGALSSGGMIDIYQWSRIGFLAQYLAVGMVLTGLPSTAYGLFLG
jgi:hypothetical protein